MMTCKADNQSRVKLPDVKPGTVFEVTNTGAGNFSLVEVAPKPPKAPKSKLVKDKYGVTVIDNGIKITSEDVYKAMAEEFP